MAKLTEKQEQLVGAIDFRFECIIDALKDLELGFAMKPKDMYVDIIRHNSYIMQFEFKRCMLDVSALDDDHTKVELQNELTALLQSYYNLVESYMCIIANEKRLGRQGVKLEINSMNCDYFKMQTSVKYCEGILKYYVWKKTTSHSSFDPSYYNYEISEILTSMPEFLCELISVERAQKRF